MNKVIEDSAEEEFKRNLSRKASQAQSTKSFKETDQDVINL